MEVREDETTTELDVDRAGPGRRTPGSAQLSSSDDPANLRNQPGKKDQRQQRVGKQSEQRKDWFKGGACRAQDYGIEGESAKYDSGGPQPVDIAPAHRLPLLFRLDRLWLAELFDLVHVDVPPGIEGDPARLLRAI